MKAMSMEIYIIIKLLSMGTSIELQFFSFFFSFKQESRRNLTRDSSLCQLKRKSNNEKSIF